MISFNWLDTKTSQNISLGTLSLDSCAAEIEETPPHLLWASCAVFFVLFCPICGPCHHKCSRPPLDTTMQSQISSWLLMGCACLLQHGFYSVLDTNTAAALYTHAAVLFSCHAVQRGYTGPVYVPHSTWLRGIPFCCCIQAKQMAAIKAFIRMLLVWALTCLPLSFQCRGGGALWWSISMMDISFSACQGQIFTPLPLQLKAGGLYSGSFYVHVLTENVQLCTCISAPHPVIRLHPYRRKGNMTAES